jgi:hypothetical protein
MLRTSDDAANIDRRAAATRTEQPRGTNEREMVNNTTQTPTTLPASQPTPSIAEVALRWIAATYLEEESCSR